MVIGWVRNSERERASSKAQRDVPDTMRIGCFVVSAMADLTHSDHSAVTSSGSGFDKPQISCAGFRVSLHPCHKIRDRKLFGQYDRLISICDRLSLHFSNLGRADAAFKIF